MSDQDPAELVHRIGLMHTAYALSRLAELSHCADPAIRRKARRLLRQAATRVAGRWPGYQPVDYCSAWRQTELMGSREGHAD